MRRDRLKLRLSDPSGSAGQSFHTSDSDDESCDRSGKGAKAKMGESNAIPAALSAAQVHTFDS